MSDTLQMTIGGEARGSSADVDRARSIGRRLECGTAWINTHLAGGPSQPFGGLKWSGIGVENGTWGYNSFIDMQVLHVATGEPGR